MAAAPKGSTVLVTGASGFIGSHVVAEFIKHGYKVRGTVRSEAKGKWLTTLFDKEHPGAFSYAIVPDISKSGAFDEAVKGCSGVAHVASPVDMSPNLATIDVAVGGVQNMLESAAKEPSVKRFVLTSSSAAATLPKPNVKFHLDQNSWNDEGVAFAKTPPHEGPEKGFATYAAGKTIGEQSAWKFVKERKPGFTLNTVLPNFTLGQIMSSEQVGSTAGWTRGLWNGDEAAIQSLRDFIAPQWYVHVSDIAALHVAGVALADVQNQRLYGFSGPFSGINSLIEAMGKIDPSHKLPPPSKDPGNDISTVDNSLAVKALTVLNGTGFKSFEEGIRDSIKPSVS